MSVEQSDTRKNLERAWTGSKTPKNASKKNQLKGKLKNLYVKKVQQPLSDFKLQRGAVGNPFLNSEKHDYYVKELKEAYIFNEFSQGTSIAKS